MHALCSGVGHAAREYVGALLLPLADYLLVGRIHSV